MLHYAIIYETGNIIQRNTDKLKVYPLQAMQMCRYRLHTININSNDETSVKKKNVHTTAGFWSAVDYGINIHRDQVQSHKTAALIWDRIK